MKRLLLTMCFCVLLGSNIASAERILFIPLDNRPVCKDYVLDSFQKVGVDLVLPPEKMLPSGRQNGDVDGMLKWLEDNGNSADAVVVATDTLIYGGLVGSRTHHIPLSELEKRVTRFIKIVDKIGGKTYAYSTIMRTPYMSTGRVEPPYYAKFGPQIFRWSALWDMAEVKELTKKERVEFVDLNTYIPPEYRRDWQDRRDKNLAIHQKMLEAITHDRFAYFVLGKDDTAEYSASHRDARRLKPQTEKLKEYKFSHFVGADQLGMLLAVRAHNEFYGKLPLVYVEYNHGFGKATVPGYEDSNIGNTVRGHIWAVGGIPIPTRDNADLVLLVNTPFSGKTLEAGDNKKNIAKKNFNRTRYFIDLVEKNIKDKSVAVADIAFSNGADNALVERLFEKNLALELTAYAGWNTASNTVGYALAQGLLAKEMSREDKNDTLLLRYTDDWAYQANVRSQTYKETIAPKGYNTQDLGKNTAAVQEAVQKNLRTFMKKYYKQSDRINATLPWERTFEVDVKLTK